jgi:ribulose 1,5-bisphosphate synthetase/thiazole synthase
MMRRTAMTATASRQRRKELMVDARINSCRVLVDGTRHDADVDRDLVAEAQQNSTKSPERSQNSGC